VVPLAKVKRLQRLFETVVFACRIGLWSVLQSRIWKILWHMWAYPHRRIARPHTCGNNLSLFRM